MPGLFKSLFVPSSTPKPKAAQVTQNITSGGTGAAGVAPGTSPDDFRKNQQAYYQQMLAGLGQGQPGGELPQGIQENIDRQASLIK